MLNVWLLCILCHVIARYLIATTNFDEACYNDPDVFFTWVNDGIVWVLIEICMILVYLVTLLVLMIKSRCS